MATMPVRISHYRIESVLGEGGMGVVYLAEDELLNRRVALKLLPPGLARDPEARRRFLAEGRAAAALNHPNAATLYEVGSDGDEMFLAMEYVPGPTLRESRPVHEIPAWASSPTSAGRDRVTRTTAARNPSLRPQWPESRG